MTEVDYSYLKDVMHSLFHEINSKSCEFSDISFSQKEISDEEHNKELINICKSILVYYN